jgi:RNA polymerase sigma-70 factor (ECF subfamily)
MLQHSLEPADLALLPDAQAAAASPFEDIATLHALYGERLFRFLMLTVRDRDLAQSLTQDTFLKAWRSRSAFRGDCGVYTWITHIALSLVRSHTRTGGFRFWKRATMIDAADLSASLPHNGRSAEAMLIAQQSLELVWRSVEQLSPRQRAIFLLRFVEELELDEIAQATGLPLSTVKTHLYRALDRVRAAHANAPGQSTTRAAAGAVSRKERP